jgi:lipoprotein-anchoring transpeptidase ErfK/SrfK
VLSNERTTSRWAFVERRVAARRQPRWRSRWIKVLRDYTSDFTPELVLVLREVIKPNGQVWLKVRLPMRPNNRTGWVPRSTLGRFKLVHTHLYVNRAAQRATLYRDGKQVFTTRVGVGQRKWPTPRGNFYIRDRLTGFHNAAYGPLAFGTSARSPVLTDWPGGGFVGIHGTDAPGLIPGYISHGCIRLRNAAILQLARLMPVGTPLTIT